MPNPFAGIQLTSKKPQDRPEAIPPIPEEYVGDNNPYRGTESHGVETNNTPSPPSGYESTKEGITYLPEARDEDPVPVRIVQVKGREFRKWRGTQIFLSQNQGVQIIGRNDARSEVRVINASVADNIWISPEPIAAPGVFNVFKLTPAMGAIVIPTQDEIWAITDAAAGSFIQTIEVYSVEL